MKEVVAGGLVAVAAALALSGPGGAHASKVFALSLGDVIDVKRTRILCVAEIGKKILKGRKLVGCTVVSKAKPAVGTYAVAVAEDGEAAIARVNKDGSPRVVLQRKPSANVSSPRVVTMNAGDVAVLTGTRLACAINKTAAGPGVACFQVDRSGSSGQPGSYGAGINDDFAYMVRFDARSQPKLVKRYRHVA